MHVTDIQMYPVTMPVRPIAEGGIAPYVGSKDSAGTSSASSIFYKVQTDGGLVGWGEMNAIISLGITQAILNDYLKPAVIGRSPFELNAIKRDLLSLYNPDINTLHFFSGVEMALWDLMGKSAGRPVYALLGGAVRPRVEIACAMGLMNKADTSAKIRQVISEGYRCIKTKGGLDVEADIVRAGQMRAAAGSGIKLRVDMNQGYNFADAARYMQACEAFALEYVEQPIAVNQIEECALLRRRSATPLAANEDCYIPGNLAMMIRQNALDAAVIDLESIGGISEAAATAQLAQAANLPLAHHCAWDMGVKTAAILHLCAALPALSLAMDSTYPSHADDVLAQRILPENGAYTPPAAPGLGVEVDEEKLQHYACKDPARRFVF